MTELSTIRFYASYKKTKGVPKSPGRNWYNSKSKVFLEKVDRIKRQAELIDRKILKSA